MRERPNATLGTLLDYFSRYAAIDDLYFMCFVDDMKLIADTLERLAHFSVCIIMMMVVTVVMMNK
jgi:hypothetical protein